MSDRPLVRLYSISSEERSGMCEEGLALSNSPWAGDQIIKGLSQGHGRDGWAV